MVNKHDGQMIRCPRLGDEVNFKYCRIMNDYLPCRLIVGCWQIRMDINKFLSDHYSKEAMDKIFIPAKPKIESLVALVEKAKEIEQ